MSAFIERLAKAAFADLEVQAEVDDAFIAGDAHKMKYDGAISLPELIRAILSEMREAVTRQMLFAMYEACPDCGSGLEYKLGREKAAFQDAIDTALKEGQ